MAEPQMKQSQARDPGATATVSPDAASGQVTVTVRERTGLQKQVANGADLYDEKLLCRGGLKDLIHDLSLKRVCHKEILDAANSLAESGLLEDTTEEELLNLLRRYSSANGAEKRDLIRRIERLLMQAAKEALAELKKDKSDFRSKERRIFDDGDPRPIPVVLPTYSDEEPNEDPPDGSDFVDYQDEKKKTLSEILSDVGESLREKKEEKKEDAEEEAEQQREEKEVIAEILADTGVRLDPIGEQINEANKSFFEARALAIRAAKESDKSS